MFNNIDRESFEIAVSSKDEVINHLEALVRRLEMELDHQRKRADIAIDRLLNEKKIGTVMPENIVFIDPEQAKNVSAQAKAMELMKSEMESIGEISEGAEDPTVVTEIQ